MGAEHRPSSRSSRPTSTRRRDGWPRCCATSRPTCSRSTTGTATTATPTTSRSTRSGTAPPRSRRHSRGVRGDDEPRRVRQIGGAARLARRSSAGRSGLRPGGPGRRRQPVRQARGGAHPRRRRVRLPRRQAGQSTLSREPGHGHPASSCRCPTRSSLLRSGPSGSSRPAPSPVCAAAGCSTDGARPPGSSRPRRPPGGTTIRIPGSTTSAARRPIGWPTRWRRRAVGAHHEPDAAMSRDRGRRLPSGGARRHGSSHASLRSRHLTACRSALGSTGCDERWPGRGRSSARGTPSSATASRRVGVPRPTPWSQPLRRDQRRRGCSVGDDRVVIRSLDNCSVTTFEVADGSCASSKAATRPTR